MQDTGSPECGHGPAPGHPECGPTPANGSARRDPPPPPEVAGIAFERPSPEMLEEARRTFDAAELMAGVREIERTGGVQIDDLIAELERQVHGSD